MLPVGEKDSSQRACSGRQVSSCDTVLRRFSFRRYWCLSVLAKRAEEAILELRSNQGLASLTTKNIIGLVEVEFEVKTVQGQSAMWKRYLVQLGATPVTFKCSAPKGGHVEADTSLVVVDCQKLHCYSDARKTAMTRPKSAAAHWLRKFGVQPVDFLPPRSGERDGVEVIARVHKDCFAEAVSLVSSPASFIRGEPRAYRDVQLPEGCDLQAALRKAKAIAIGPTILGVTLRNKGLGLRTKECDFEVVGQIYTTEEARRFIGDRWEVTNLPLSSSKAAVQAFLSGWKRRLTEQGRQGAPLLGQQCLLSITDCSTIVGARSSAQRSHENVQLHSRSFCGQNLAKPRQRVRVPRNPGQMLSEENR